MQWYFAKLWHRYIFRHSCITEYWTNTAPHKGTICRCWYMSRYSKDEVLKKSCHQSIWVQVSPWSPFSPVCWHIPQRFILTDVSFTESLYSVCEEIMIVKMIFVFLIRERQKWFPWVLSFIILCSSWADLA